MDDVARERYRRIAANISRSRGRRQKSPRMRLPCGDAQKVSNLLAGFSATQSFLDRTRHGTGRSLKAAEFSPCASKFESDLPRSEDSNTM
jgi:hypothetical protein